jgi:hypothetical protein
MSQDGSDPAIGGRVRGEHRRVESLFLELLDTLARGARPAAVAGSFSRLRAALETHFAQEDRLYYPALAALRPDQRRALDGFALAHEELRGELAAAADALARESSAALAERFAALAARFAGHEAVEEALLRALEADPWRHENAST